MEIFYILLAIIGVLVVSVGVGLKLQGEGVRLLKARAKIMNDEGKSLSGSEEVTKESKRKHNIFSSFLRENWFRISILMIAVVVAATLYQYLITIPQRNRESANRQRQFCMGLAESQFNSDFELNSKAVPGKEGVRNWNSADIGDAINGRLEKAKDLCIRQYPVD